MSVFLIELAKLAMGLTAIIIVYFLIGVLFAILINRFYAPLDGVEAMFCWPWLIVTLLITISAKFLKKLFDKLSIPNDIDVDFYHDEHNSHGP